MPKLLKKRGGARPGSGQKPIGDSRRIIKTIALEQKLWDAIEAYRTQAGLSRNGAVHKLLSERLLPADDFEQALAALDADPEFTPSPTLARDLEEWLHKTPSDFSQSLAYELGLRPVKRGAFDWSLVKENEAINQNLKRLTELYGEKLVELLTSGRTDLKTMRLKEICDMSERARRCSLLELAGITF